MRRRYARGLLLAAVTGSAVFTACGTTTVVSTTTTTVYRTSAAHAASTTSSGTQSSPTDMAAVPIGTGQHVTGRLKDGSEFAADVTVKAVRRTSDYDVVADVVIDVSKGTLPASSRWTAADATGNSTPGGPSSEEHALGDTATGHTEGVVAFAYSASESPVVIRYTPYDRIIAKPVNSTATWMVSTIHTAYSTTPSTTASSDTTTAPITGTTYNPPNVNIPNGGGHRHHYSHHFRRHH